MQSLRSMVRRKELESGREGRSHSQIQTMWDSMYRWLSQLAAR